MKRIALAIGTAAMGLAVTGTTVYAQAPAPARPDYSLYGGPTESRGQYPERLGTRTPSISPLYKMSGVPDEITAEDEARETRRNAAVEFGMFRRQFTGSTEFWMDHDRTQLAKVRYAMDEPMWRSIHPSYDWGDGGYMYNTAASVGGPQWPGTTERVVVTPPAPSPMIRNDFISRSKSSPNNVAPSMNPVQPSNPTAAPNGPLVASDRDVTAVGR